MKSLLAKLKGDSSVTINGQTFRGTSVSVSSAGVLVDGQQVEAGEGLRELNITINGDVDKLECAAGSVVVNGNVGKVETAAGAVKAATISGNAKTISGSITCSALMGDAKTVSGAIRRG